MRLTPHQILKMLGFDVPEGGIEINPVDMTLHAGVLAMAGRSIDLTSVPEGEFTKLHAETAATVATWRQAPVQPSTPRSAAITRTMAMAVLTHTYKLSVKS